MQYRGELQQVLNTGGIYRPCRASFLQQWRPKEGRLQRPTNELQQTLLNGWEPHEPRENVIHEGTDRKRRELLIPSLRDHFVHTAVARALAKHTTKRFYFYSCGSLPDRGQTFAIKAVEGRLRKKRPKYCLLADIKGFYRNTKKDQVMRCLRRVFKDERFLELNEKILDQREDLIADLTEESKLDEMREKLKDNAERLQEEMVDCSEEEMIEYYVDQLRNLGLNISYGEDYDSDIDEVNPTDSDEDDSIYQIDQKEYCEGNTDFSKEQIDFYEGDSTFVDLESDEVVDKWKQYFGPDILNWIEDHNWRKGSLYVRNMSLSSDYQIILKETSYSAANGESDDENEYAPGDFADRY